MNEFIVWDKLKKCFADDVCCDVRLLKNDISYSLEIRDELFELFYNIGLKDINNKNIYADSSIFEFKNSQLWNKYNGIFFYNKQKLCYQIKIIGSIRNNEIIPYDKYCSDFKIIDTIQENKLGLIK